MSPMLIGIDVSLKSHHVQFMDGTGTALASFAVPNDQTGADTLIQKMLDTASKVQVQELRIGMEATSNLGWHLAHYLKTELQGYEPNVRSQIYVLNARKVSRFKKGYEALPKNDRVDAWFKLSLLHLCITTDLLYYTIQHIKGLNRPMPTPVSSSKESGPGHVHQRSGLVRFFLPVFWFANHESHNCSGNCDPHDDCKRIPERV